MRQIFFNVNAKTKKSNKHAIKWHAFYAHLIRVIGKADIMVKYEIRYIFTMNPAALWQK